MDCFGKQGRNLFKGGYFLRKYICIYFSLQPELRIDFENAVSGLKISNTNVIAVKKLSTMTPLQILCSFQTWNAKNVSDSVHKCLEKLVSTLLDKGQCVNFTFKDGGTIQDKKIQVVKPKKYKNCIGNKFFLQINRRHTLKVDEIWDKYQICLNVVFLEFNALIFKTFLLWWFRINEQVAY